MATKASGVHTWLVLSRTHAALAAHARRHIESLGLGESDFSVLEALLHKGPLPVNLIGRKVLLTSGSMTSAVDRLERQGLVERRKRPEDRRVRLVQLTPKGRRLIAEAFPEHERAMGLAASGLGERDRATLIRLLKRLGRHAEQALSPTEET
jgi:MarR family 2-MHQ and catechol resistance regulon transcriptional repressor